MLMMRLYRFLFTTSALLATTALAANVSLVELASELPSCSINCIVSGLESSGIGLNNLTATCGNDTLQSSLSICIQSQCNVTDQFKVAIVNQQLCKGVPFMSRSRLLSVVGLVLGSLALIAIALRCYSRLTISREFGYDDIAIAAAGVFLAALIALDVANCAKGYGRHYWNLNPLQVPTLLKIFWVAELFYIIVSTLIRVSILTFYLRVFPLRSFKIINSSILGVVIASGAAISLTVLFQCTPVSGVWDRTLKAKCVDLNALAYTTGGISIVLDIVVLILPIPQLLGLKMNSKKKINLMIMFSLGGLACITSIIRLKFIINFGGSEDQTWDNVIPALWSLAEVCVATMCACLPALRLILMQWFPCFSDFSTLPRSKPSYTYDSNQNSLQSSQSRPGFREKVGPSYDKRTVRLPDEESFPRGEEGKGDGKTWISKSFFTNVQSLVASPPATKANLSTMQISHSSIEMFAIEGPRLSDESNGDDAAEETGISLREPEEREDKGREIRALDMQSTQSLDVDLEKELPPLPLQPLSGRPS